MKRLMVPLLVLALAGMACNLVTGPGPSPLDTATAMPTLGLLATLTQSAPAATATAPAPSATPTPTGSGVATLPPVFSPTPPPTVTSAPTRPATATRTSPPPAPTPTGQVLRLKMFLIALEDAGASGKKIGCDDSAVPVTIEVPRTQGVLRAALERLLALDDQYYGESGLYNALYQSDLEIESLAIQNGEAVIRLTGELASGGVCDDPRIVSQLEETALQFSTIRNVTIFVNGVRIQDLLSGRGG